MSDTSERPVISRLALGLAALGRPAYINLGRDRELPVDRTVAAMRAATWATLDAAYARGLRWVDVARSYGRSEEFLADWLADRGHTDVTVSSKWGYAYVADWRPDAPVHEVKEHSRARLRTQWAQSRDLLGGRIDLYQVHSLTEDSPLFDDVDLLGDLAGLAAEGVRLGFSTSGPRQADTVRRAAAVEVDGRRLFQAVQSTWNPLEPSVGEALAEAHAEGLHVLVKEALANGRLVVRPPEPIVEIARRRGVGPDAVALAAALSRPWVDTVLLGPAGPAQLRANLAADGLRLDDAELHELLALAVPAGRYWNERAALSWT
ncbi:aryl-alcohol dehydrogenase-like predicted oxidoreductase [Actinoalloteichus hoggarensis]|uniref:aldo/keto reductase n=1 Tax=Actinoalloteichus hoggarensis TaxID=1470176 RepID=UPI0017C242A5|nr:aldo/keto reductase [Actinoalloteichus hoggarensis]MBB5919216.1 aryl-alcohol dehydrogenase-like predicted oxidoreductase [Actinoalloteichus hoggarensis]